jgi:hypothetical protein
MGFLFIISQCFGWGYWSEMLNYCKPCIARMVLDSPVGFFINQFIDFGFFINQFIDFVVS